MLRSTKARVWQVQPALSAIGRLGDTMLFSSSTGGMELLSSGTIVGIAVVSTAVVIFIAEALAAALAFYCISKHQSKSSKPKAISYQQPQVASSSNPLQQSGPEYEEVVKLRKNASYELTQTGIEMKANEAYQSTQHWSIFH